MLIMYDDELIDRSTLIDVENNVEELFAKSIIIDTPEIRRLIKEIDQGEFLDGTRFKDRFGYTVYLSELSSGCKAALCVCLHPNKIIDLVECGINARDSIIRNCSAGNIIFYKEDYMISGEGNIDVLLQGKHITTVTELNDFIDSYQYYGGTL